jgi:hypothetical protein
MVSQALQLSMRVQQQVTELAIKGDDALSTLRAPEESPAWATFDEDEPDQGSVRRSAFDAAADPDGEPDIEPDIEPGIEADIEPGTEPDIEPDIELGLGSDLASTDGASVAGDPWAAEERAMLHELDSTSPADTAIDAGPGEPSTPPAEAGPGEPDDTPAAEAPTPAGAGTAAGPTVLPDYGELTLAQVRARMRRLSIDELTELVDYERAHADRPSFVGMLNRRIATLRDQR